jgi:hypothetical protein
MSSKYYRSKFCVLNVTISTMTFGASTSCQVLVNEVNTRPSINGLETIRNIFIGSQLVTETVYSLSSCSTVNSPFLFRHPFQPFAFYERKLSALLLYCDVIAVLVPSQGKAICTASILNVSHSTQLSLLLQRCCVPDVKSTHTVILFLGVCECRICD